MSTLLLCSQMCSGFRYLCLVPERATPSRPHFFSDLAYGKGVCLELSSKEV